MLRDIVGMSADEIAERRAAPTWSDRLASVSTMIRESRLEEGWRWDPDRFRPISVPTLLLVGSETTPDLAEVTERTAAAIPGSEVQVLQGHGHVAHAADPSAVAQVMLPWLR